MDNKEKIQYSQFLISRFDHYNDSINNKGAFYLSINTFILGGICVGYSSYCKQIKDSGPLHFWILFVAAILLVSCLISTFFTITAIAPYLKDNHVNDDKPSLIYFGGINRHTCTAFVDKFSNQSDSTLLEDCARQAHSLANGLTTKFRKLKWASRLLFIEYLFLTIIIFLIFQIL